MFRVLQLVTVLLAFTAVGGPASGKSRLKGQSDRPEGRNYRERPTRFVEGTGRSRTPRPVLWNWRPETCSSPRHI